MITLLHLTLLVFVTRGIGSFGLVLFSVTCQVDVSGVVEIFNCGTILCTRYQV